MPLDTTLTLCRGLAGQPPGSLQASRLLGLALVGGALSVYDRARTRERVLSSPERYHAAREEFARLVLARVRHPLARLATLNEPPQIRVRLAVLLGEVVGAELLGLPAVLTANVFCPTGPGGGVDASCSPGGGGVAHANAFDAPASPGKAQTLRDFFRAANLATSTRPDKPAFHRPARLEVERRLVELAGPHAESLFLPGGGATLVSGPKDHAKVMAHPEGVALSGGGIKGPDPRNLGTVVLKPSTPPEERDFYMRVALGLKTSSEDRRKYLTRDSEERKRIARLARERKATQNAFCPPGAVS
jgi:hypothetical protein